MTLQSFDKTVATVTLVAVANHGFVSKGSILFYFKPGKNITFTDI
jgi:hypothetical protein